MYLLFSEIKNIIVCTTSIASSKPLELQAFLYLFLKLIGWFDLMPPGETQFTVIFFFL